MLHRNAVDGLAALSRLSEIEAALGQVIRGKADVIRLSLACLLARGHLLIEDVPGVGKTTLAQALARSVDASFHRIQFTSDMLPSDVVGVTIYNAHAQEFEFKQGPVFTKFLLADEINRATPKTQSALLEAMNELQVTVDGRSYPLPQPFMVIATQNPVEHHGTYPLAGIAARPLPDAPAHRLPGRRFGAGDPAPTHRSRGGESCARPSMARSWLLFRTPSARWPWTERWWIICWPSWSEPRRTNRSRWA